jgi:hypothetical protein
MEQKVKIVQKIYVKQGESGSGNGGNNAAPIQVIGAVNGNNTMQNNFHLPSSPFKGILEWCSHPELHHLILREIIASIPEPRMQNLIMAVIRETRRTTPTIRATAEYLGIDRGTVSRAIDRGHTALGEKRKREEITDGSVVDAESEWTS